MPDIILTDDGSNLDPKQTPTANSLTEEANEKWVDIYDGPASYQGKPFSQANQGDVDGRPAGVMRKYYDRRATEFKLEEFDGLREELALEWAKKNKKTDGTFEGFDYKLTQDQIDKGVMSLTGKSFGFSTELEIKQKSLEDDSISLFERQEKVIMRIPKPEFKSVTGTDSPQVFKEWLEEIVQFGSSYTDSSFQMSIPVHKRNAAIINSGIKQVKAGIEGSYNYEIPKYEQEISTVREELIQNIYTLFSAIEFKDTTNPSIKGYIDHATLEGRVDTVLQTLLKKGKGEADFRTASYYLYLQAWTRVVKQLKTTESGLALLDGLADKFDHLIFPQSEKELLTAFGDVIELFPMHVEVEFGTDALSPLSTALEDMKISLAVIIMLVVNDAIQDNSKLERTIEVQETTYDVAANSDEDDLFASSLFISEGNRKTFDILQLFRALKVMPDPSQMLDMVDESFAFLGDGDFEFKNAMRPENSFYRKLLLSVFETKLKGLTKDRFRSFARIIRGELAPSETIVYEVQKWGVNAQGDPGSVIQKYWVPNTGDKDIVRLFDTQVKYNQPYIYRIYAYQCVYGTRYQYESIPGDDNIYETDAYFQALFTVKSNPYIRLWKVPYYNLGPEAGKEKYDITRVLDKPPVAPSLHLTPYIGKADKILLSLNTGVGTLELTPDVVNTEDIETWKRIALTQFKVLTYNEDKGKFMTKQGVEQTILFRTDDSTSSFEIYRLDTMPTKYSDFAGALRKTLEQPFTTFVDDIVPNQKYYYMARAIDSHGNPSKCTYIYTLKMVANDGIVFPEMEVKTIDELAKLNKEEMTSLPMQKYLQIKPSVLQRMLQDEFPEDVLSAADVVKPKMGMVKGPSSFDNGKTFKVRIKSKKTGRKIDINLKFTHEHSRTLPEQA
jgi:hypothetical protein